MLEIEKKRKKGKPTGKSVPIEQEVGERAILGSLSRLPAVSAWLSR
jgi:hypothetical protein